MTFLKINLFVNAYLIAIEICYILYPWWRELRIYSKHRGAFFCLIVMRCENTLLYHEGGGANLVQGLRGKEQGNGETNSLSTAGECKRWPMYLRLLFIGLIQTTNTHSYNTSYHCYNHSVLLAIISLLKLWALRKWEPGTEVSQRLSGWIQAEG